MKKTIIISFILFQANLHAKTLNMGIYAMKSELLPNMLAKEICSCLYVTDVIHRYEPEKALEICLNRANLPVGVGIMKLLQRILIDTPNTVIVDPTLFSEMITWRKLPKAYAVYDDKNPQYGCSLNF
jgi:hypothetical protein